MQSESQPSMKVILASGSPRRRELMGGLDVELSIVKPEVVEGPPQPDESPEEYAMRLSHEKAL